MSLRAKNSLAQVYFMRGELGKAKASVEEVLKESPNNVDGHMIKGNILLREGDGAGAVAEFRTIVSEKPQFIPGYLLLAQAHLLK